MTVLVVLVMLIAIVAGVLLALAVSPSWHRSRAIAERNLYATQQSREAMELRHEIRGDVRRVRKELDHELRQAHDP